MTIDVRPATTLDWIALAEIIPNVQTCVVDGEPVAMGGTYQQDGTTWAFLTTKSDDLPSDAGRKIIRALRAGLSACDGPVFIQCDEEKLTAKRLLIVLNFKPTLQRANNMRVWKWQP